MALLDGETDRRAKGGDTVGMTYEYTCKGQPIAQKEKERRIKKTDGIKRKQFLYHVTDPKNIPSIMQMGLRRSMGGRTTFAVYLSERPESWWKPGLALLKVDISGLQTTPATTFLPDMDEVIFWGDIPLWKMTKTGTKKRIQIVREGKR